MPENGKKSYATSGNALPHPARVSSSDCDAGGRASTSSEPSASTTSTFSSPNLRQSVTSNSKGRCGPV
eukprot:2772489-Pyramimonas_sp.AAC.1